MDGSPSRSRARWLWTGTAFPAPGATFLSSCAAADGSAIWIGTREGAGGPGLMRLGAAGAQAFTPLPATPTDIVMDTEHSLLYAALSEAGEIVRFARHDDGSLGRMEIVARIDLLHGRP